MTDVLVGPAGTVVAARLLAHWWSRPTPEEVDGWSGSWPDARRVAGSLGLDPLDVEELERAADSPAGSLAEEYERLFVGPGRVPCSPYEALWREDGPRRERGSVMGTATQEVIRLYGELGLAVRHDAHELADHVAVEWEALAYALEAGSPVAEPLLGDHLAVWLPAFCARVEQEAGHDFYRALARATPAFAEGLARSGG